MDASSFPLLPHRDFKAIARSPAVLWWLVEPATRPRTDTMTLFHVCGWVCTAVLAADMMDVLCV